MNELNQHLIKLIKLHGPLPVSSFMTEALTNPKYGYYVTKDPFGRKGDFTTAPEISQMFGELIGLWFADVWLKMDRPIKIHLIELGPGRGTLMADFMRAVNVLPPFKEAIELHFVEASPELTKLQKDKFKHLENKQNWHDTVKSALNKATDAPTFIIANEFFDALPIRQFQKGDLGWHERMVTFNNSGDGLMPILAPFPVIDVKMPDHLNNAEENSIVEVSPMAEFITSQISNHISNYKGAALFIDYGYTEHRTGETLQAVKDHKYADVFENPGTADLSAHVNFRKLAEIMELSDVKVFEPIFQGKFLNDMGIEERVKSLLNKASADQSKDILKALNRLIAPDEMGTLFKASGMIYPKNIDVVGFDNG